MYGLFDLTIITSAVMLFGLVVDFVVFLLAGFGLFDYLRGIARSVPERLYPLLW